MSFSRTKIAECYDRLDIYAKKFRAKKDFVPKKLHCQYNEERVRDLLKEISDWIGLQYSGFVIGWVGASSNAAGQTSQSGFAGCKLIELDPKFLCKPHTLVVILAHELAHHVIWECKCELPDRDENERLTDLTAIYMGFGKQFVNSSDYYDNDKSGEVGYWNGSERAFAYDLFCVRYCWPESEQMNGISDAVISDIRRVRMLYSYLYPKNWDLKRSIVCRLRYWGPMHRKIEKWAESRNSADMTNNERVICDKCLEMRQRLDHSAERFVACQGRGNRDLLWDISTELFLVGNGIKALHEAIFGRLVIPLDCELGNLDREYTTGTRPDDPGMEDDASGSINASCTEVKDESASTKSQSFSLRGALSDFIAENGLPAAIVLGFILFVMVIGLIQFVTGKLFFD